MTRAGQKQGLEMFLQSMLENAKTAQDPELIEIINTRLKSLNEQDSNSGSGTKNAAPTQ